MSRSVILYGTSGCHLCEDAAAILIPQTQRLNIFLEEIDIAGDDALEARYGIRIPVLAYGAKELGWPFTAEQALDFLATLKD